LAIFSLICLNANSKTKLLLDKTNGLETNNIDALVLKSNFSIYLNSVDITTITSFSPTTAGPGDVVTITGTNFKDITNTSIITNVSIGGVPVTSFDVVSSTKITAVVATVSNVNNNNIGNVQVLLQLIQLQLMDFIIPSTLQLVELLLTLEDIGTPIHL